MDEVRWVVAFLPKVQKTSSCWLWTGATNSKGYGNFWTGSRLSSAHIESYKHLVGPIPEGLEIDHTCEVPLCVNPQHLEPVTHDENLKRWAARRLSCKHNHIYTPETSYITPAGHRQCIICNKATEARRQARRKAMFNGG